MFGVLASVAAGCGGEGGSGSFVASGGRRDSPEDAVGADGGSVGDGGVSPPPRVPTSTVSSGSDAAVEPGESVDAAVVRDLTPSALVTFADPEGDAEPWPGMLRYPLDVVGVELETVSGELVVRFQFSRTLAEHFAFEGVDGERTAGAPCEVYLDLDDDPSTGVEPIWASESIWADELVGYDVELDVLLSYEFIWKDDGSMGSGGGDVILDDALHEITGYFADYWFLDHTEGGSLGPADAGSFFTETRDFTSIDGDVVELRVPLDWLGLSSGDVVRVMYRESDEGPASGVGYSWNERLIVQ